MLKYHVIGRWPEGAVDARFVQSTRIDTAASHAAIDSAWARMSADPGLHLFNGPMCRLESFHQQSAAGGPRLRLDLSLTSYRIFLGTNLHGPPDLPRETLANPVGVSPALETSDGFLLFGRRNARVAYYPHRLHPFSGSLEPPVDGGPLDIFAECRRELAEELSLTADEVTEIELLGVVEDEQIRHPELILRAKTTLARWDFESRLNKAEHVSLHAVPADPAGVAAALGEASFTPVALASLTLFTHDTKAQETSGGPDITCPCCGYITIRDTFDLCPICGWKYDPVQSEDPDDASGPNRVSLRQAQGNFVNLGRADDPVTVRGRSPGPEDARDPNWHPIT